MTEIVSRDETQEQRQQREFERLTAFNEDCRALRHAVDSQSPFVPEDIYRRLQDAIQVAHREATEVRAERRDHDRNPMRDWYQRGRDHHEQFCTYATEISDLIRARLKSLTVLAGIDDALYRRPPR
jgi:hypothetical protein